MTKLAQSYGVSRPVVYDLRKKGAQALHEFFLKLQEERQILSTIRVDKVRLFRAIISSYVKGANSIRNVQDLVLGFYELGVSVGTIHSVLAEAEQRAAAFNKSVSLENITDAALDELFSQGDPVLAGIDLDSDYLFLLEHRESRSGDDWAECLENCKKQGLQLEVAVKDAGTGLAAGVSKAFPGAEHRDDSFHVIDRLGQVRQKAEKRAWAAMERLEAAMVKMRQDRQNRQPLQSAAQQLRVAIEKFNKAAEQHDQFEVLMKETIEAMSFIGLDSIQLRDGKQQADKITVIAEQMRALGNKRSKIGKCIRGAARYLKNRAAGLSCYMDHIKEKMSRLSSKYNPMLVGLICQFWRCSRDLKRANRWNRSKCVEAGEAVMTRLISLVGSDATAITHEVMAIIEQRHRASSAIESFNSRLRPYLYVHKRVSQPFLELFKAWRNLRTRKLGKRRGTSAYELLTGDKVDDWLSMLGYPLSQAG